MKKKNRFIAITLSMITMIIAFGSQSSTASAAAQWPALSSSAYCEFTSSKTIYVYRNTKCTTRGTSSPARSYNSYIETNDVCRIMTITSSYIQTQFPTSSGYKTGYIKRSDLFGVSSPTDSFTSKARVTTYKKPGGASYGYIASGDRVYVCGTSGNYYAIIYQAKSGNRAYKLGYIAKSDYNKIIGTTQNTSSWRMPMDNAYCTWRSYSNMSWASYNNTGTGRNYHLGVDIYGSNSNVYAAADGKVVACSTSNSGANGRFIVIQHTVSGKTVYSFYAHLASLNVYNGQNVKKGTRIAYAGGSGYGSNNRYGKHLHFAIVNRLNSKGSYYGYATYFSGNSVNYQGTVFYNPVYVVNNNRLP